MQRKLNVLVFGNMAFGHMIPLIPVVEQLIANGHEIVLILGDKVQGLKAQSLAKGLKVQIHAYPKKMSDRFAPLSLRLSQTGGVFDVQNVENIFELIFSYTNDIIEWLYQTFGHCKFDIIIADSFSLWGYAFASKYRTPLIISQTFILVPNLENQLKISEKACQLIKQFNQKHGTNLKSIGCLLYQDQQVNARYINYNTPHFSLEQPTTSQPPTWYHVDHNMIQGKLEPKPLMKGSIIYISIGTVFNNSVNFFKMILQYFISNDDYKVIISAGASKQRFDLLNSLAKPDHVEIKLWVDQKQILKDSSVFISHCGFNSLKEGILYGNVIIAYPQNADQPLNSELVEKFRVGLYPRDLSQYKLDSVLNEIARNYDFYFKRITDLRGSFKQDTINSVSLANEIEQFVDQAQKN